MARLNTRELGDRLSDQYGYNVDVAGNLSEINQSMHERRIESMLDKVVERYIPENETVESLGVGFDPWDLPEVKVWCKSTGFDHENNQVHDAKFMVNGHLYHFKVDVRPF